jgi:hypothetical protein
MAQLWRLGSAARRWVGKISPAIYVFGDLRGVGFMAQKVRTFSAGMCDDERAELDVHIGDADRLFGS